MTKEEERIVKAFMLRTKTTLNNLRDLADSFAKVGMTGVSDTIKAQKETLEYNMFEYMAKELKIKD